MIAMSKRVWFQASTWLTFVVWGLVAACAVYWGLRLQGTQAVGSASALPPVLALAPEANAIGRVLGFRPNTNVGDSVAQAPVNPPASSRFALQGVVYQGGQGVALIAIDGKPAKHFRVGAEVDTGLVLKAVAQRSASLGPSRSEPTAFVLELPAPSVMVSTNASPALSSRPLAPGTPAVATPLGTPARPIVTPPPQVAVQVPGMASQYTPETAPEASADRQGARGSSVRGLMQGAAGAAGALSGATGNTNNQSPTDGQTTN